MHLFHSRSHTMIRAALPRLAAGPCALLIVALLLSAPSARAELTISFTSPGVIHVQAWHTRSGTNEVSYSQSLTDPGGGETALLDGPSAVKSVRIDCDSSQGDWNVHTTIETVDGEGNHHVDESDSPLAIDDTISGVLLFSETLTGSEDDTVEQVQVPNDITLTLEGTWLSGSFSGKGGTISFSSGEYSGIYASAWQNGSVTIAAGAQIVNATLAVSESGSMTVENDAVISSSRVYLYDGTFDPGNAHSFSGNTYTYYDPALSGYQKLHAASGTIVLGAGSAGATLSGEDYDIIMETEPITFDIAHSTVRIHSAANISGGISDSAVTVGDPIIPSSFTGEVNLTGLHLNSLGIWGAENCSVSGCEIRGSTLICMGTPEVQGNVFIGDYNIMGGSGATISGNAFHGTLVFFGWDNTLARPTISGNDLLGGVAVKYDSTILFPDQPAAGAIVIGNNYYGGSRGPSLDYGGGFLGYGSGDQGGWVSIFDPGSPHNRHEFFAIQSFATKRLTSLDPQHYPPKYWVAGWAAGQGVLDWSAGSRVPTLYRKIPTLLSFDVKSSARLTSCPDIFLRLNGSTELQPSTRPPTLSRDLADFSKTRVRLGGTTVNFRLAESTDPSLDFELVLRDGNGETVLASGRLEFIEHPWVRPLRIAVIPIGVEYTFSSIKPPPAAPMSRFLKYVLPSLFPVPPDKLQIDLKSPEWMETNVGLLSNLPGLAALAGKLSLWYVDALANPKYDLVVAVMPPDSIRILSAEVDYFLHLTQPASGVNYGYGENFWLSTPRVLFVDAEAQMAAIHEMGHAAGLYRDMEEYDMPEYKKTEGMPLRGFSSAGLDEQVGNVINGFPPSGIVHFATTNMTWYAKEYEWINVMGLPETQVWPSQGMAGSMMAFFNGLLSTTGAVANAQLASLHTEENSIEKGVDQGTFPSSAEHQIAGSGGTPANLDGPAVVLSGIAIEPPGRNLEFTADHNSAMETSLLPITVPALEPASNWYQYGVIRFYDSAGTVLAEPDFDFPLVFNESAWWIGALPLPPGCVRYSLFGHRGGTDTLKSTWQRAGTLTVQIDRSVLPTDIGSRLDLLWNVSASDPQPDSHLASQVLISTNNGANWFQLGKAKEETYVSFPTDSLPKTESLAIRVVVSDGFTSSQDTVSGLRIPDRSPNLSIIEPRNGDVSLPDAIWEFKARAWDLEDGELAIVWQSSRDGVLSHPTNLSIGTHRLTCSTSDSAGHMIQTNLTVQVVSTPTTADLCVDSLGLLGINHETRQAWNAVSCAMIAGATNVVECIVRNSGIQTTGTVTLTITDPNRQPLAFAPVTIEFEPFDYQRVQFPFVPETYGAYTFAVTVQPASLSDRSPANNTRSMASFTYAPTLLVNPMMNPPQEFAYLYSRYSYPYPPPDFVIPTQVSDSVTLYNGGYVPLVLSNAVLTCGPDFYGADHFRIYPPAQFPVTLQPGEEVQIDLQFYGKSLAPEATTLRVRSNDPRRPDFEIPIHGWVYPPDTEEWRDQDLDGIPTYIETAIGLNPLVADSDSDGLLDGQEDRNANGTRELWETGGLDPDTDGDGLTDGEEDANANGGHDAHETSALLVDSDGDGVTDSQEMRCRTDGLNAGDRLVIGSTSRTGSEIVLIWDARRLVSYVVEASADLVHWEMAPSGSAAEQKALRVSPVDGASTYRVPQQTGPLFYRLGAQ